MAGDTPLFESALRVPEGPRPGVQAINAPQPDYSEIGAATAKLGIAAAHFQDKLQHAQAETDDARIKSDYLTSVADLRETYTKSRDFKNAPDQFATDEQALRMELLGRVPDEKRRTTLGLYMTVHGLSAGKEVTNKQFANEADANVAGLNERSADYLRKAATAGSPTEAAAVVETWNQDVDQQANAGWISRKDAVARKVTGLQSLDDAGALALIRINPRQAALELADPEKFKWLGVVQRENLINAAKAQSDKFATAELGNIAQRDAPRALLTVGRVGRVADADQIFDRGIVPIESNGDPAAVSPKGALGLTQLMPDTARAAARRLGRNDIAALDDAAIKTLLTDPKNAALNLALGRDEWRSLLGRYDGKIAVAAAGYNAGPSKADEWLAKATQEFGPNFTAAQFASVVSYKETRDYIAKLYMRVGADPHGAGLSPEGQLHAASVVHAAIASQDSERNSAIKAVAAIGRESDDPAAIFKAGYEVDPVRYAAWRQTQSLSAQAGDLPAAKALRDAEFQRELLPARQAALRTAPVALEAYVQAETANLAASHDVTPDQKNRLDVAREVLKSMHQARHDNIIGLAEQAQLVPEGQRVALDPRADPASQDFRKGLALRGVQANAAAGFYLGTAIAFKPEELAALKDRWSNAGPDEKFKLLQAMGSTLEGRAYTDTLAAVLGNDHRAELAGRIAVDRPEVARDILRGSELLKSKEVSEKAALVKPAFASKFAGQIYPSPAMQKQVEDASVALYVARAGNDGTLYDAADTNGIEKAIEDVAGKIVRRNGDRVPAPPGMSAAQFSSVLDRLSNTDLAQFGGAYDRNGRAFEARTIAERATLKPLTVGGSLYVVGLPDTAARDGFAPVWTASEIPRPLIIDVRALAAARPPALTPYQQMRAGERALADRRMRAAHEGVENP